MVKKRNILGNKGIEALLAATKGAEMTQEIIQSGLLELPVSKLNPGPYQPRNEIKEIDLESLTHSIRAQGVIQPIVVRQIGPSQYEIIAGERRWRAAQLAGLATVPVVVKKVSNEKAMAMALIENIQREDLTALEEAEALERLSKEFGLTHIQVAEAVGKSRTAVTNLLRLLTLTDEVKRLLESGVIEAGHAKALLGLKDQQQKQTARIIVEKGLSVREAERLINQTTENVVAAPSKKRAVIDPDVKSLQQALSAKLGATVEINHGAQGRGRVIIQYNTLEELEGILEHIH